MSSLYVDRRGVTLKSDGEALAFYENGQRIGTVPLAPLDRVFLRGDVTLQTSLLAKLGEHGIGVVVLSGRKGTPSLMLAAPHNDAARRLAQFRLAQDAAFCLVFTQALLELKLKGQQQVLLDLRERNLQARYELTHRAQQIDAYVQHIGKQPNLAALRGVEGSAAASYFAGLAAFLPASLRFTGRNRRPPRDPFNAVLSLAYTLLHSEAVVALHGAGLDPFVGFFHGVEFGRESLACDVIEPLRPLVDRWLLDCFRSQQLRVEDFSTTAAGCMLGKAGRARFYAEYEKASELWRKKLTESIRDLIGVLKAQGLPDMPQGRVAPRLDSDMVDELPDDFSEDWPDDLTNAGAD